MTWKMVLPLEIEESGGTHLNGKKNDKFLATIINSKCQKNSNGSPRKAGRSTNLQVRAVEGHLSYFHIEEIIEILGGVGDGIA